MLPLRERNPGNIMLSEGSWTPKVTRIICSHLHEIYKAGKFIGAGSR